MPRIRPKTDWLAVDPASAISHLEAWGQISQDQAQELLRVAAHRIRVPLDSPLFPLVAQVNLLMTPAHNSLAA